MEVGFLETGESVVQVEGKDYPVKAGDLFVIFPNLIHSYVSSKNTEGHIAILTLEDLSPFSQTLSESLPSSPILERAFWNESDLKDVFLLAQKNSPLWEKEIRKGYSRVIAGKLLSLLSLQKRENVTKSALREILNYLSSHSGENLTRKSIARALGFSESTVSHAFSQGLKTSLPAYLNGLRLEEGATLLRESTLSVTEISESVGFGSLRSFNRAFRENFGISPTQYRKNG